MVASFPGDGPNPILLYSPPNGGSIARGVRNDLEGKTLRTLRPHWRIALAVLPLATGAGLVVYILSRTSLWYGIAATALIGTAAGVMVWRKTSPAMHALIRQRGLVGIVAGLLATFAYDLSRLLLVTIFHYKFWPFDVFPIFGRLLAGSNTPRAVQVATGWLYHLTNGSGFGAAYMFLFQRPRILTGLMWAGVLEVCMVTVYPGWLGLKALDEFLSVSVLGHAAYGVVLGFTAQRAMAILDGGSR